MSKKTPMPPPIQEELSRRSFLKLLFGTISGFITLCVTWPFMSFLTGSMSREQQEEKFIRVPNFDTVPLETPTKLTFEAIDEQAFIRRNEFYDVWVVKHSPTEATVFSPLCTHLSCRVHWKSGEQGFSCPCHGSVFDAAGKVLAGPAPRPMDPLPHRIEGGQLYVKWKIYKPGIPHREEA